MWLVGNNDSKNILPFVLAEIGANSKFLLYTMAVCYRTRYVFNKLLELFTICSV